MKGGLEMERKVIALVVLAGLLIAPVALAQAGDDTAEQQAAAPAPEAQTAAPGSEPAADAQEGDAAPAPEAEAPAPAPDEGGTLETETTAGTQVVGGNAESNKFEEYREVPGGVVLESFSLLWRPKDRWYFETIIRDAAQEDQFSTTEFGQDKFWNVHLGWQENPRRFQDNAVTPYAIDQNFLFLPDALQAAIQAAPTGSSDTVGTKSWLIRDMVNNAGDVYLGYQRQTGSIGFEATPTPNWRFNVDAQEETREGNIPQPVFIGSSPGGSGSEIAAPVDYRTTSTSFSTEYIRDHFSAGGAMLWSTFSNDFNSFVWDNHLRITDDASAGPARGRMANYPDSDYTQLRLWFSGNTSFWNTRFWLSDAWAETTQNDAFLPMTINTAINQGTTRDFNGDGVVNGADDPELLSALPALSLHGRYDTHTPEFRLTTQPADWMRIKAWWRGYERDDKSDPFLLGGGYVAGDSGLSGTCSNAAAALGACTQDPVLLGNSPIQRQRVPFDYKSIKYGIEPRFGHFGPFLFSAGLQREDITRNAGAVEDAHETTLKLTADFDGPDWLFLRASWKDMSRSADSYHAHYWEESFPNGEPNIAAFNEGMRRYYQTDRDRIEWAGLFNITPVDWRIGFYGEAAYARSKYYDPNTGQPVGSSYMEDISNYCEGGGAGCTDPVEETILIAGRIYDDSWSYTLGLTYDHPSARFSAWTDYTWEGFNYDMASRYRNVVSNVGTDDPQDDWGSSESDRHRTWTLGFESQIRQKIVLSGSWVHSDSEAVLQNRYAPGGAASGDGGGLLYSPELYSSLSIAHLGLEYRAREDLSFLVRWWYEDWKSQDFAEDYTDAYNGDDNQDTGSRLWFLLGGEFEDYVVNVVQFLVRLKY
jgi:hypothetical protein